MVSRRTNFGERSEPAPDGGGKLQSAGGGKKQEVTFRHWAGGPHYCQFRFKVSNFLTGFVTRENILMVKGKLAVYLFDTSPSARSALGSAPRS